ncbi:MAG: hypothetical protein ACRC0B_02895 [Legionella sp.]
MNYVTEELLALLRHCANALLLAYGDTLRPDVWSAFEKTADACETLAQNRETPTTYH